MDLIVIIILNKWWSSKEGLTV